MNFLLWYDDSKRSTDAKIRAALDAYRARFGTAATIVLTSAADTPPTPLQGGEGGCVAVRSESHIQRNNFWIGREEANT